MKILNMLKDLLKESLVFKIIAIVFLILSILGLISFKDFVISQLKLESVSKQIARVRIADEHDLSIMGKSYKDKIYEKYDTVQFGKYYQSNINNIKTPIDWIVLAKEDNRALLLSKYILDCKPFNNIYKKVCHWNDSTIRRWLNNDFYNIAFSDEEKRKIIRSELENKRAIDSMSDSKATDSSNTYDNVFLLSDAEFLEYLSANKFYQDPEFLERDLEIAIELWGDDAYKNQLSFNFDNATTCGTPYAYKQGLKNAFLENTANYWLRTNDGKNEWIMFVTFRGWTFMDKVNAKIYGIRPAIWVSLEE